MFWVRFRKCRRKLSWGPLPSRYRVPSWYITPITWHKDLPAQGMLCDRPPGLQFLSLHCVIVVTPCFLEGKQLRSDPPPMRVVRTQNHVFFPHVMSKAFVGILRWVLRAVVGPDRPQSQKGTDNDDVAPVNTTAPKKAQTSAHSTYKLSPGCIRQVILLQDPPPNKRSAGIPPPQIKGPLGSPPNKGSAIYPK